MVSPLLNDGDFELICPPKDGISSLRFFKEPGCNPEYLLATSWDGSVQVHDTQLNKLVSRIVPENNRSILDACILTAGLDRPIIWTGGLSGSLYCIDWEKEQVVSEVKDAHLAPIKSICSLPGSRFFVSGSWDSHLMLWESTCGPSSTAKLVSNVVLSDKVYAIDCQPVPSTGAYRIVVGMANRNIDVFEVDLNSPKLDCIQKRESSLKYQTRCVRICPIDPNIFVCSSIEGRVSVDYIEAGDQAKKYAFKCHRSMVTEQEPTEVVYPVNAIAFHPKSLVFATGGSDASACIWDLVAKRRIKIFPGFPTSISALDFDLSGQFLAVASSYCFEEGEKDTPLDSIYIKKIDMRAK
ncbi:hypothetical protein MDAP_001656 [Mitosporidium daphniae]